LRWFAAEFESADVFAKSICAYGCGGDIDVGVDGVGGGVVDEELLLMG